jgi:hypothetical protein
MVAIERTRIQPGQFGEKFMPFSEVCMSMRVAGTRMRFQLLEPGRMAQLYRLDGSEFSFPITAGEAGVFSDSEGHYYYPNLPAG